MHHERTKTAKFSSKSCPIISDDQSSSQRDTGAQKKSTASKLDVSLSQHADILFVYSLVRISNVHAFGAVPSRNAPVVAVVLLQSTGFVLSTRFEPAAACLVFITVRCPRRRPFRRDDVKTGTATAR